jgi:hypothetical protein
MMLDKELQIKLLLADRPWEQEPQQAEEWVDADTGYECSIWRNPNMGHLCGYVGIPKGHPCYGVGYNDMDGIEVHGGLTYSEVDDARQVYAFGFDAGHGGDFSPGLALTMFGINGKFSAWGERDTYRTWAYVKENVLSLCKQLKLKEK